MSLFDRFRKKPEQIAEQPGTTAPPTPTSAPNWDSSLRGEVASLYDKGVHPLRAIQAMLHERDGSLSTDVERSVAIWLGMSDLLDRDGLDLSLRDQLVSTRDVLGKAIVDSNPKLNDFVANYLKSTKKINEMRFLQAYKPRLMDENGIMQREAFEAMLADIEHQRDTHPGSLAQDISDEALAKLYRLRDNWDTPESLR